MSINTIAIHLDEATQTYMAIFGGPQAAEIRSLCGTNYLPTPYTAKFGTAYAVAAKIQAKNPECVVTVEVLYVQKG